MPTEPTDERKTLGERLTDATSVGFAWSILLHAIFLIAAGLFVFPIVQGPPTSIIEATDAGEDFATFDTIADIEIGEAGGSDNLVEQTLEAITPVDDVPLDIASLNTQLTAPSTAEAVGEGSGDEDGDDLGGLMLRAPKNAVRQGRFTAWTIPEPMRPGDKPQPGDSPRPMQNYRIVIEIELPKNMRSYSIKDLEGEVIGTDGYRFRIPDTKGTFYLAGRDDQGRPKFQLANRRTRLPIIDNRVQIIRFIPGAQNGVRDTISISSRRLAESQRLELVFGSNKRSQRNRRLN